MKKELKKKIGSFSSEVLYHLVNDEKVFGKHKKISGNCSWLEGNCSWLEGNCSWLEGNFYDCEITQKEREKGIDTRDLVK